MQESGIRGGGILNMIGKEGRYISPHFLLHFDEMKVWWIGK
jgi:hypothetical protein